MAYLRLQDYYTTIQDANLQQVLSNTDSYRTTKEQAALTEITSYLIQKYDCTDEFRDTKTFSFTTYYKAKQLVQLDATAYSNTATYALNALTLYQGKVYYNITAITVGEAFTSSKWTLLGAQYDLFYIPVPFDEFNVYSTYSVGDNVFYKDKIYTCKQASVSPTHQTDLQYGSTTSIPLNNLFPDTPNQNQWTLKASYTFQGLWPIAVPGDFTAWSSVTAYVIGNKVSYNSIIYQAFANNTNVEPGTDSSKWVPVSWVMGDNRNQSLVEAMIYLTIYKLSTRISPRNIPDIWVKNYDDTIKWLKQCAKGEWVTLDMPVKQPKQGSALRHGSEVKRVNRY
jgi:hypothetical protein